MDDKKPNVLTTADFWFSNILNTQEYHCYGRMYSETTKNPKESLKLAEMYLSFPHQDIEGAFNIYRQLYVEPVPRGMIDKYKFNKNLYNQIMAVNDSDEKWLNLIISVKDFDFIQQNIETRIAENPANKNLWKFYIEYLKDDLENIQILLSVYYCYCRLFIDDNEVKAELKQLELKEKRIEPEILPLIPYPGIKGDRTRCKRIYYNSVSSQPRILQNVVNQCFSFPKTVMTYMMDNASAEIWHKFYQTCKYFFHKKQAPVIHQLRLTSGYTTIFGGGYNSSTIDNYIEFEKQSLVITAHDSNLSKCKNAILSNYLKVDRFYPGFFLSNLISNLHSSQIKFLQVEKCFHQITIDEFDFLVGHGKVELAFLGCEIKDANGEYIPIEDLVARFPLGRELQFCFAKYNQNSAEKLAELERYAKLEQFRISKVTTAFNVVDYIKFAAKNTFPDGLFDVTFDSTVPEDTVAVFRNSVEQAFAGSEVQPWFTIKKA